MNRDELIKKCIELGPWFHQIDLGGGIRTRDIAPATGRQERDHPASRWNKIKDHLPADMTGMRVLDVGCSDGYFSIQMARRHAREVVAIDGFKDCVKRLEWVKTQMGLHAIKTYHSDIGNLQRILVDKTGELFPMDGMGRPYYQTSYGQRIPVDDSGIILTLGERIKRHISIRTKGNRKNVLPGAAGLGKFDMILMFALLYHLRDPLAGLEMVSKFSDVLYIETLVINDDEQSHLVCVPPRAGVTDHPKWYPTTRCLKDMLAWVGYTEITELAPPTDGRPIYLARKSPASRN